MADAIRNNGTMKSATLTVPGATGASARRRVTKPPPRQARPKAKASGVKLKGVNTPMMVKTMQATAQPTRGSASGNRFFPDIAPPRRENPSQTPTATSNVTTCDPSPKK